MGADGWKTDQVLAQHNCQQKRAYGTAQLALNAGWLYAFKHRQRFSVYQCGQCARFHLSKQVGRTTAIACVPAP